MKDQITKPAFQRLKYLLNYIFEPKKDFFFLLKVTLIQIIFHIQDIFNIKYNNYYIIIIIAIIKKVV